ncbi:hypothetical protein PIB30_046727 [Stylosanthes scabra]|uniref:Uncharacterized protein n=1 Tax=Stylosanthes scabra TaxID=79078 RepID=A0ABU6QG46_9FABA|nr:hypothetical protein [Stylosanthes scabra]
MKKVKKEEDKPKQGSRVAPPPPKNKEKKEGLKPAKKKKKHEEVKSRKKKHKEDKDEERIALKCSSFGNLLGKLKKIGKAFRNNQKMDAHLVKDHSKWKELTPRGCVRNFALTPELRVQQRAKGPLSMIKIADTLYPSSFSLLLSFKHSHSLFFPKPIFLYLPFALSPSSFITTTK